MTTKEGGLRGSIRNVGVGVSAIPDSVIHRWRYDEGSNTTVADSVGTADGTINGATWVSSADGLGGNYLSYDGSNDYTEITGDTVPTSALSVFAVVNPDATDSIQGVVARGNVAGGASDKDYELGLWDDGSVLFTMSDGSSSFVNITGGGSAVPDGSWSLIAGTWDGSTAKTYIGTTEQASQSASGTPTSDYTLRHGGDGGQTGRDFGGGIDAPGVANEALTESDLQSLIDKHPAL